MKLTEKQVYDNFLIPVFSIALIFCKIGFSMLKGTNKFNEADIHTMDYLIKTIEFKKGKL